MIHNEVTALGGDGMFMRDDIETGRCEDHRSLINALGAIVGADRVREDQATRRLVSEDIWHPAGMLVAAVVSPGSLAELSAIVSTIAAAGYAIAPRGAGMSYTGAYRPALKRCVSIDMTRMNRILRISRDDMTVTVEAGVTWKDLNDVLAAKGLRTPFWGPMSGLISTVGGGLSQLNAMLGAGRYGTSSESVVALTVVASDGLVVRTGARGRDRDTPHYRHYGPDFAGLFCGDCGTLGIKAEITLRLIAAPGFEDHLSFSFPSADSLLKAMAELARREIAAETCAFDPGLTTVRMQRASLTSDVKTLGAIVAKEKNLGKGLLAAAKIAIGGRNFIAPTDYPLHLICEGRSQAAVDADADAARRIAALFDGQEVENTIAKVIRAMPFPPLNSVVGPNGEAWVPVHGVCSLSNAPVIFADIEAFYADRKIEMDALQVRTGFLFTTLSTNGLVIEPVFFWPQGWRAIHEAAVEPAHLARLQRRGDNPDATKLVAELREAVIAIFEAHGCGHFQIGRTYPYRESRDEISKALLDAVKAVMDPANILNPGVLGFPEGKGA